MIDSEPTCRLDTSNVALEAPAGLVETGALPTGTPLAKKVTDPVGLEPETGTTAAVNCTACANCRPVDTELERPVVVVVGAPPPMIPTSPACE